MELTKDLSSKHYYSKTTYKGFIFIILLFHLSLYNFIISEYPTTVYLIKTFCFYFLTIISLLIFIIKQKNKYQYLGQFKYTRMLIVSSFLIVSSLIITTLINPTSTYTFIGLIPDLISITFYFISILLIILISPIFPKLNYKFLLNIGLISLTILGVLISIQFYYKDIFYSQKYILGFAGLGNRNYGVMPFSLMFFLSIFELLNQKKKKYEYYLYIGMSFNIILISFTRGAWVGIFISFIFATLYILKNNKKFFQKEKRTLLYICLVLILVFLLVNIFSDWYIISRIISTFGITEGLNYNNVNDISSGRLYAWKEGFKLLAKPKIFLIGISPTNIINFNIGSNNSIFTDFHNQYLECFVSLGIFGFIGFLLFIISIIYYSYKLTKHDFRNISLLSCSLFLSVKWLFNSINSLNFVFSLLIISFIIGKYINLKKESLI